MRLGDLVVTDDKYLGHVCITSNPGPGVKGNPGLTQIENGELGLLITSCISVDWSTDEKVVFRDEVLILFSGPKLGWCLAEDVRLL